MDRDTDMECEPSPPCVGSGKSKLDTLSKEDLIKFAKKQMAIMQKLKAKCADLDKEMEVLKALPSGNSNDSVIQELTEKMDAVLLEKAENQQSLVLLRKENETFKKQAQEAKDNALQLQEKLDSVKKEHMNKITALEKTLETNKEKHREELKQMEKNENEEIQRLTAGFNSNIEAVRQEYESQVNTLKHDLELAKKKHTTEIEALMATHQMGLKKSHENLKNVQDELARQNKHHEHDIRILEEQLEINATHFDMERERFVKELSEQQLYKENCLQDVEEEEEFSGSQKASGVMNMPDATTLEEPNERLRLTLQDLQSQNAMLQEELVFLSNVKTELECNLKHIKEEFAMEREELEFKINELQMMKGDSDPCVEKEPNTLNELRTSSLKLQELQELHKTEMKELETRLICDAEREKEAIIQELNDLQSQCMVLAEEKIAVISEYEHTKEILRNLEMELNDRTCDFVKQYNAMKAQSATSIEELQEQLQEKDDMIKKLKNEVQTSDTSLCKAEPILSTKNEDIIFDLHKTQGLCQDVKEIHITMISDPENLIRLEKIRTDIESILDAYRSGHMVTAQLEPQTLQDLWMALEGALAEGRHFRSRIACLEDQLSLLATERGSDDEVRVRDIEDHPDTSQLQDKAYTTPCEQQHGAQRCLCSALVESDAHRQVSEILKQKYSVIIAEEDIAMLFNQLLSRLQIDGMILPQQHFSECEITGRMTDKNDVGTQGTEEDLKSLQLLLSGKEAMIAQLNEEISHLQEFKISTCNRNVTQIEILEKEIKEKDERMNKIKAVAVKAKKELENSKKEACAVRGELDALQVERDKLAHAMRGIIHGAEDYKNLMTSYDRQAELLEKEREKLEGSEKQLVDLTKRLQAAGEQHKQLCSEKEDLSAHIETLQSNVRQLEAQLLETQKLKSVLERDLEAEKLLKEQKSKDHQSAVRDLEETRAVLHQQKQQLQQTEQELEQLRKDAKQSTLLDMEMADYERLVRELNVQLSEKSRMLEQQENLAQAQRDREEKLGQEIESLKSLVEIGEEKTSKMKQLLVKTKKELAEAKQEEASQMVIQSSLKGELEGNLQQLEVYKIQCSELQADRHRLQEQLKSVSEQHQKASSSLQCRLETLQEELSSAKAELCSTLSEFEGYKVRVHNVLKQQKTRSSAPCEGEFSKQEREHMESLMEQLRSKLQESHVQLQSSSTDLQQLQSEHDTLLERHNRMLQQTVAKEAELRERLLSLHSENTALKSEHAQSVAQLTAQADALRSSFREQVRRLQEEERSTVDTLQQQIGRLEAQLFQLQKEPSSTGAATVPQSRKPHADRKLADLPVCELPSLTREEGEGMETTEVESVSSSGSSRPSLEQLLTSPEPKQEPFLWQAEPSKEELSQKLSTATRSMAHMNHLLRESEATNAVLMEQISLLKSELRRLERNQEREKSVANLEYLKNVLLRFMVLQAGSEKQALLPVIHTLLQLSPDEKSKLAAIAQGEEEAEHPGRSGWTSYLHSWYSQMLNAEMLNAEILNAKVLGLVCKGVDAM